MDQCKKCKAWDGKCSLGKVNPETLQETITAFKRGGRGYVCTKNKHIKEAIHRSQK